MKYEQINHFTLTKCDSHMVYPERELISKTEKCTFLGAPLYVAVFYLLAENIFRLVEWQFILHLWKEFSTCRNIQLFAIHFSRYLKTMHQKYHIY